MTSQELLTLEESLERAGWLIHSRYVAVYTGWLAFASRGNALSSYKIAASRHEAREAVCEWAEGLQRVMDGRDTERAPPLPEKSEPRAAE